MKYLSGKYSAFPSSYQFQLESLLLCLKYFSSSNISFSFALLGILTASLSDISAVNKNNELIIVYKTIIINEIFCILKLKLFKLYATI